MPLSSKIWRIEQVREAYRGLVEFELWAGQTRYLVFVPRTRGGGDWVSRETRLKGGGAHPPPSVMGLRKHLVGARLSGIEGSCLRLSTSRTGEDILFDVLTLEQVEDSRPSATSPEGVPPEKGPEENEAPLLEFFARAQARGLKSLDRALKKKLRLIANLEKDLEEFSRHPEIARQGELLKTQLHLVKRGSEQVELEDWFSPEPEGGFKKVLLKLDASKEPQANLELFFKRAARYRRGIEAVGRRLEEVREELARLEEEREVWLGLEPLDFKRLKDLAGEPATAPGRGREKREVRGRALPWRRFEKKDVIILVGKNAAGNAHLSLKLAAGNDLWFHAKNWPGAHVILRRRSKGHRYSDEEIKAAAILALYYSEAKKFGREEVLMTEAKHLRRIPGAPQGTVSAAAGRSLVVSLDDEALREALRSEAGS